MITRSHNVIRLLAGSVALAATMLVAPGNCSAQYDGLGPRFEAGAGLVGYSVNTGASWASNRYGSGLITGALRLFKGLAVHGGMENGYGGSLEDGTIQYGDNTYIDTGEGPYMLMDWYGLRYELPMSLFDRRPIGMSSVYVGAGIINAEFGVRSDEITTNGVIENTDNTLRYRTASCSGRYAVIAARWRLETIFSVEPGTWLDAIGVDAGIRYSRFSDVDIENRYLDDSGSSTTAWQVFIAGLVKFDLLY